MGPFAQWRVCAERPQGEANPYLKGLALDPLRYVQPLGLARAASACILSGLIDGCLEVLHDLGSQNGRLPKLGGIALAFAAAVMLGIAAERVFLLLCNSLAAALNDPVEQQGVCQNPRTPSYAVPNSNSTGSCNQ